MSSSLSRLADNITEELHKDKCKVCKSHLEYMTVNDGSLIFKCIDFKKNHDKELIKIYPSDFKTPKVL